MHFTGTYRGDPVQGVMLPDRLVVSRLAVEAEIRLAVQEGRPAYIAGLVDDDAAIDDGPAGYATVATILDPHSVSFDPPLEVEEIPEDAEA